MTSPGWVDRSQPVHGGPESKTPQSSEQLKSNKALIYYEQHRYQNTKVMV